MRNPQGQQGAVAHRQASHTGGLARPGTQGQLDLPGTGLVSGYGKERGRRCAGRPGQAPVLRSTHHKAQPLPGPNTAVGVRFLGGGACLAHVKLLVEQAQQRERGARPLRRGIVGWPVGGHQRVK